MSIYFAIYFISYISGRTPLHDASWTGHFKVVNLLLKNGADVNKLDKRFDTIISSPFRKFNFSFNFNSSIYSGKTALHLASINDQLTTADLLIKNGATIDVQDNAKKTPLLLAINNGILRHNISIKINGTIVSVQHISDKSTF